MAKGKKTDNRIAKQNRQTIIWSKEKRQTIKWPSEKRQTIK
jgi:hypothetical protein